MLKLCALSFRPSRFSSPLVCDIEFEAKAGQLWVFLGPNGSGKTTLLKTILGLLRPTSGQVLLCGKPLETYSHRERAQHMAWVPQHLPEDVAFSALELVSMGRSPFCGKIQGPAESARHMASAMLQEMGLLALANRPLTRLSGGERRMLWLSRAFVQTPKLLCLDEPTAFLDMPKQSLALEFLKKRCQNEGLLALVVLHELNLAASYATHALLLKNGRALAQGPAAQLLNAKNLSTLFDMPLIEAKTPDGQTLLAPHPPLCAP